MTQVLDTFFTSSSTSKTNLQKTQAQRESLESVDLPLIEEYQVREYVSKLDIFKSLDPGGIN